MLANGAIRAFDGFKVSHACAYGHLKARAFHGQVVYFDHIPQLFRSHCRLIDVQGRDEDGKFLAAVPCDNIRGADVGSQQARNLGQRQVAVLRPQFVIDFAEVVDVDHDQRQVGLVSDGPVHFLFKAFKEVTPVGETGQRIVDACLYQYVGGSFQLSGESLGKKYEGRHDHRGPGGHKREDHCPVGVHGRFDGRDVKNGSAHQYWFGSAVNERQSRAHSTKKDGHDHDDLNGEQQPDAERAGCGQLLH